MIEELDAVVLTRDVTENSLNEGDVGTVVHAYEDEEAFEVEFVSADGSTIGVLTLSKADIRPIRGREILHVRDLARAATA